MDFVPPKDSPDKPDSRPSFRKPSNDSANRKYRHHSPVDGSDSSSSGGSRKHEQNISPGNPLANRSKVSDDKTRKYYGKEPERGPGHSHSSRGSDSYRYSDKKGYRSSREDQHSDDGGYNRLADDEDRDSALYSKYGRELKSGRHDCARHSDSFERSKETSRNADRSEERYQSRDKYENFGHRSRGKDRGVNVPDHRYNEKESSRAAAGSRQITSRRDNRRDDEWERLRERDDRDDRRIRHRSPSDYRKEYASTPEDNRGHSKDSYIGRETGGYRLKESQRKEIDEQDCQAHKRRYNDKDNKKYEDKYSLDPDENRKKESDSFSVYQAREEKSDGYVDKNSNATEEQSSSSKRLKIGQSDKIPLSMAEGKPSSSSKQVNDSTEKFTLGPTGSANNHSEAAQDLNAAKVAAMKAAELVNKNLVGTGFMSTDQKKKLLWGSKKSSSEESGNRWDLQLFSDRERQEKFNKLMSLRLPWYVWPIVGCEGRGNSSRAQARRKGCGEAERAADRFGEAVHCRFATQRWPHGWSWSVIIFFCFRTRNLLLKKRSHSFVIFANEFKLNVRDFVASFCFIPMVGCFFFAFLYEGWLAVLVGFMPLVSDQDRLYGIILFKYQLL